LSWSNVNLHTFAWAPAQFESGSEFGCGERRRWRGGSDESESRDTHTSPMRASFRRSPFVTSSTTARSRRMRGAYRAAVCLHASCSCKQPSARASLGCMGQQRAPSPDGGLQGRIRQHEAQRPQRASEPQLSATGRTLSLCLSLSRFSPHRSPPASSSLSTISVTPSSSTSVNGRGRRACRRVSTPGRLAAAALAGR